jgi:teichuronic acid biosynthesis glycosyltransferase TuaC
MRTIAQRDELVKFRSSSLDGGRMRILFITNMWPDPVMPHYGTFIRSQAESLEAANVAVDVLTIRGYSSNLAYAMAPRAVLALSRARAYDVVHVHTGHAAAVSMWGVPHPMVLSFVGADVLGQPRARGMTFKSRIEITLFRQLARAATRTITKSKEMEDALPAAVRARNHVIPNGVDVEAFAPQSKAQARTVLGWGQEEKVVLFLGDPDDPRKNVALARAAVALGRRSVPNLRLHLAWGARPEEVPRLMWAADCLAFPSRSEGSPNVVKEAMAAALPVVATAVGDVPERLAGVSGCFVVPADPPAFADALLSAVQIDRAPAARQAVLGLSLPKVAERVIEVYESVRVAAHADRD